MALTNEDLQAINSLLEPIRNEIKSIELTLENETNRNIQIIAEGHLDLVHKLDDALKVENEKEMLLLRVNHLEDLLAMSQLLDVKLDARLKPMENDIKSIKDEQTRINLIIENDIQHDINILVENYVPAAKRYQDATAQIQAIQADIEIMKKIISDHSEKLKKIS